MGDSSQSNYYLYSRTRNYSYFFEQLTENLQQCGYPFAVKNIFHPFLLGKILTRGPLHSKYLQHTKFPPILNVNLNFSKIEPSQKYSIQDVLQDIPAEHKSEGFYSLFGGKTILFIVKKLNISTIHVISKNLTESYLQCLIYFEREEDHILFVKKLHNSGKNQKTIVLSKISELKKIVDTLKHKYSTQELAAF